MIKDTITFRMLSVANEEKREEARKGAKLIRTGRSQDELVKQNRIDRSESNWSKKTRIGRSQTEVVYEQTNCSRKKRTGQSKTEPKTELVWAKKRIGQNKTELY